MHNQNNVRPLLEFIKEKTGKLDLQQQEVPRIKDEMMNFE